MKQYALIEHNDGNINVYAFWYNQSGMDSAMDKMRRLAKENDIEEDIIFNFDPSNTEAIANVSDADNQYDLLLMHAAVKYESPKEYLGPSYCIISEADLVEIFDLPERKNHNYLTIMPKEHGRQIQYEHTYDKYRLELKVGDEVLVNDPTDKDNWNHAFTGTIIKKINSRYVLVRDQDDDVYTVAGYQLSLQ